MLRSPSRKIASAALNALVVFGAASFAIAQNANLKSATLERSAPLPLSALTASATPPLSTDPKPVPVVDGPTSKIPTSTSSVSPAEPAKANAVDIDAPQAPLKAAAIDPIVEPIKRMQPTVASVKGTASAAAKEAKPASATKNPATKVAAWKQKTVSGPKQTTDVKKASETKKTIASTTKPGKQKIAKN
jgi:hypothetical protein